jgi:hypothetical protein
MNQPMKPEEIQAILAKEGIQEFSQDIRLMKRNQLIKHFSYKKNDKVNATLLMKNIIWQAYSWIKQGKQPLVDGNIRSFWYSHVKPVLSRLQYKVTGDRFVNDVYYCFVKLRVARLFEYSDFGFIDERGHARLIGKERGNVILFAEKDGLFSIVKSLALAHGITGISLNGFPSYLTTEFLIKELKQAGFLDKPIKLFSIVDYDPSGYWIEKEFARQFEDLGVAVESVTSLVDPKKLPSELVEACKFSLKHDTQTKNWLAVTGGINGEAFGLEADALGAKRIGEALAEGMIFCQP